MREEDLTELYAGRFSLRRNDKFYSILNVPELRAIEQVAATDMRG